MKLYKIILENQIPFLVIHAIFADNPLRFRRNLLERIYKILMIIDGKIRDEKLQHDINSEAAEISALLSGKIATGISYRPRKITFQSMSNCRTS